MLKIYFGRKKKKIIKKHVNETKQTKKINLRQFNFLALQTGLVFPSDQCKCLQ